jgi:hypothetical protein
MGDGYRAYRVTGVVGSEVFSVMCQDGQYDYEQYPGDLDDDEPIQIAIGEYMEEHGIDPGIVHR